MRRIDKGLVIGEPGGIGVAVRADDRQRPDTFVKASSDRARRRVCGKQAIGVERKWLRHMSLLGPDKP